MTLKQYMAATALIAATLGGAGLAAAQNINGARDEIRRADLSARDLLPVMAQQMGNSGTARFGVRRRGSDDVRTIMAVGRFEGEARAIHEIWDRYPGADLGNALSDLDSSFRTADDAVQRSRVTSDVHNRWGTIRDAYFRFQDDMGGRRYNNGQYDNNGY
ncbi:MAG: hypothetical protein LC772_02745, partial [Chloroflexi bacterium]|nr:hypothetical protein [Chloroflexota bacterium]